MNEALQLIFLLAHQITQWMQPILGPICIAVAWATVIFGVWHIWATVRDSVARARQMHQIPCADCQYFSGNYLLKCPLHPKEALTEAAVGCRDYESDRLQWPTSNQAEKVS
jgi:hypothetical protein